MRLRYFARIREQLGCAGETIELPPGVSSVGALLTWLRETRPERFAPVLDSGTLLTAVNQDMADAATPVGDEDEVALFPPVTGG